MLSQLNINNFTLVDNLDLELHDGMTAITGETGAGKSILLDALGLTLGDRADSDSVRQGQERADICARFDITLLPAAQAWLSSHDLACEDECLLRRVVTAEGRSRAYINGQAVTLSQLRQLGELLINIHSQHEHQSLLKKETHRQLLDDFGNLTENSQQVNEHFKVWKALDDKLNNLRDNQQEYQARLDLLTYQLQELDALDLEEGELTELEAEQKHLAHAETILHSCYELANLCGGEEQSLQEGLNKGLHLMAILPAKSKYLVEAENLLNSAHIQIQEALVEIERHIDTSNMNPERLQEVEERLSSIYQLARKHRIHPSELTDLQQQFRAELEQLSSSDEQLDAIEQKAAAAKSAFIAKALVLSQARKTKAKKLEGAINTQLAQLGMGLAKFVVNFTPRDDKPGKHGLEDIEFLIATNLGQPARPLAKVASGGELSRISLAIQVVLAQTSTIPTLVFDEVDVGIGGATADIVGKLLRQLGERGQVICITHLGQVASKAHQHLRVEKTNTKKGARSTLVTLQRDDKVEEIARMLGGHDLTPQSVAHAQAMLENAD